MNLRLSAVALVAATAIGPTPLPAADYHHVHLTATDAAAAVRWYTEHMGCEDVGREDACSIGNVWIIFFEREPSAGSVGSGVDHIGFSYEDLDAKMAGWQAAGVTILNEVRDIPGLFKLAFIEDPWGTKIEAVEDHEDLGFHHIHLSTPDPEGTLAWYQDVFGGEADQMKGRLNGVRFGRVWLLASLARDGDPEPTQGRSLDHLGFGFPDLDAAAVEIKAKGVDFVMEPRDYTTPAGVEIRISFVLGPDGVFIEVVQPAS